MWLAWVAILLIVLGFVSLVMGGAWSIFPVVIGAVLLAFYLLAMRGKKGPTGAEKTTTRSLPGDETVSGTHKETGYAHEGQAPGHQSG